MVTYHPTPTLNSSLYFEPSCPYSSIIIFFFPSLAGFVFSLHLMLLGKESFAFILCPLFVCRLHHLLFFCCQHLSFIITAHRRPFLSCRLNYSMFKFGKVLSFQTFYTKRRDHRNISWWMECGLKAKNQSGLLKYSFTRSQAAYRLSLTARIRIRNSNTGTLILFGGNSATFIMVRHGHQGLVPFLFFERIRWF